MAGREIVCEDLFEPVTFERTTGSRKPARLRNCACKEVRSAPVSDEPALHPEAVRLLESFPRAQYLLPPGFAGFTQAGALDLFSGSFGSAKALLRNGAPWVLCFEWCRSAAEDLLNEGLREK